MTKYNVTIAGMIVDFEAAVYLMDDAVREEVHMALAPCGHQQFIDAYVIAHEAKFSEDFIVN